MSDILNLLQNKKHWINKEFTNKTEESLPFFQKDWLAQEKFSQAGMFHMPLDKRPVLDYAYRNGNDTIRYARKHVLFHWFQKMNVESTRIKR